MNERWPGSCPSSSMQHDAQGALSPSLHAAIRNCWHSFLLYFAEQHQHISKNKNPQPFGNLASTSWFRIQVALPRSGRPRPGPLLEHRTFHAAQDPTSHGSPEWQFPACQYHRIGRRHCWRKTISQGPAQCGWLAGITLTGCLNWHI